MRFLGLTISRAKAPTALSSVDNRGGWWPVVREAFAGAWQHNVEVKAENVVAHHAVFACQTLIAGDIAKLRVRLVAQDSDGIWSEVKNPAYSPVLRKPNHYQSRIQFIESWVLSKLQRGNAYILKQRDGRGVVVALYVLNPDRVTPLVASDGTVFYDLHADPLSGVSTQVIAPASEIIHDRFNCLFHPLVGLSPIFANGLAATQGLAIQNSSARLFLNGARPSGILTAPGEISEPTAQRLKEHWDNNYSGENAGKVAVLGDGLKFEAMAMKSTDAQLVEQLKWSAEVVCSTFHVPPYKVGIGAQPTYNNVQALNTEYYSQCLQILIEAMELCLDEGLGMADGIGTEFDVDNLLRMDSVSQMAALKEGVGAGILSPNEARAKIDRKPVAGGESPYLQEQNYSLAALSKRDAQEDPWAAGQPKPPPAALPEPSAEDQEEAERAMVALFEKDLREALNA
ncbi:phage portal protein [Sphingobium sp. JS3065]|uniref:phage portal protein n=1 Tax=Sphingobium sp. JS3065 TaxID=2970925 RepID=UPI0022648F0A|nr:phage portal protein [Sphingobium sp. JS3065]UZW54960.1 phage portal protein [Sphingobium sp. JS3065]